MAIQSKSYRKPDLFISGKSSDGENSKLFNESEPISHYQSNVNGDLCDNCFNYKSDFKWDHCLTTGYKNQFQNPFIIDGDIVRKFISYDIGYSIKDREIQISRILGIIKLALINNLIQMGGRCFIFDRGCRWK